MISKRLRAAVVAAAAVATFDLGGSAAADTHGDGGGRLSATSGAGGFIVDAPVRHAYWATFGDWILCDTAQDQGTTADAITITGVRYVVGRQKPLRVRAYLRRVTPLQVSTHLEKPEGVYSPFTGLVGRAPRFAQRYANHKWAPLGRYRGRIAGTEVLRGCDAASADAQADEEGQVPEHTWIGLVLAVKVGRHEGRVRRTLVDYKVGGSTHTLRISWAVGGQGYLRHR